MCLCFMFEIQVVEIFYAECDFASRISERCERWKRNNNTYAEYGHFYPLSSVEACMDQCLSQTTCVAIDIWSDTCSLHVNAADLMSNRESSLGVTQFVLDRTCSTTISTVSVTPTETGSATTSLTLGAV